MPRLTSLPARLSAPGHRIGKPPVQTQQGPRQHRDSAPWRAWYKTARWRALRQEVLIRDAYTCRACQRLCGGKYPADDSPVVDHRQAHRGNQNLFWDRANLQVLCKAPCHDRHKQAQEQATRHQVGVWD